jgi:hypothetical protein
MQVVVFTENNARVIYNPSNIDDYKDQPNVLIDPKFDLVVGVPPHFWKKVHDRIEPMTEIEKGERLRLLDGDQSNVYSVNDMYLRVNGLQNTIKSRDETITQLNDDMISLNEKHTGDLAKMKSEMLAAAVEKDTAHIKFITAMASDNIRVVKELKSFYKRMIIVSGAVGGILGYLLHFHG